MGRTKGLYYCIILEPRGIILCFRFHPYTHCTYIQYIHTYIFKIDRLPNPEIIYINKHNQHRLTIFFFVCFSASKQLSAFHVVPTLPQISNFSPHSIHYSIPRVYYSLRNSPTMSLPPLVHTLRYATFRYATYSLIQLRS